MIFTDYWKVLVFIFFESGKYGLFWSQKGDGKMIFTWEFQDLRNMVFRAVNFVVFKTPVFKKWFILMKILVTLQNGSF